MAAQAGELICRGLKSGRTYALDLYAPDAAGSKFGIASVGNAASTSDTTWFAPEDLVIKDFIVHTGQTSTSTQLQLNSAPIAGGMLRNAVHLDSLNNRPQLNFLVMRGQWISLLTQT